MFFSVHYLCKIHNYPDYFRDDFVAICQNSNKCQSNSYTEMNTSDFAIVFI